MSSRLKLLPLLLPVFIFFSCTKSSTTTPVVTYVNTQLIANIDSISGYYYGVTSGDSIYTYTDSTGHQQQWLRSFSWIDTLNVSSPDTATVIVTSKYYTISFPYSVGLTIFGYDSVGDVTGIFSYLQYLSNTQGGYVPFSAILSDTALNVDHVGVSVQYGYNKRLFSNGVLFKKQ